MKALFGVLFLVVLVYGMYSGAMAMKSYFDIGSLVDDVVPKEIPKLKDPDLRGDDRTRLIKDAVLKAAKQNGMTLDPNGVVVIEEGGTLRVRINAPYHVQIAGKQIVDFPVTTENTFTTR